MWRSFICVQNSCANVPRHLGAGRGAYGHQRVVGGDPLLCTSVCGAPSSSGSARTVVATAVASDRESSLDKLMKAGAGRARGWPAAAAVEFVPHARSEGRVDGRQKRRRRRAVTASAAAAVADTSRASSSSRSRPALLRAAAQPFYVRRRRHAADDAVPPRTWSSTVREGLARKR